MTTIKGAIALLLLSLLPFAYAAAATPAPKANAHTARAIPVPILPRTPLHTEFVVEVNKLGQIVRVKSGKDSKDLLFNAHTYGNVLNMWIRHRDGTAEVGLYRVTFDYNPKGARITRRVSIISRGGNWGDQQGAANEMMDEAQKQAERDRARAQATPNLPSLQSITKPTPHP